MNLWPAPDMEITIKSCHSVDGIEFRGKRIYKSVPCVVQQCVVVDRLRQTDRPQEAIFSAIEKVIDELSDEHCEKMLHDRAIFEHVLGEGEC